MRDARFEHASLPCLVRRYVRRALLVLATCAAMQPVQAQTVRPWLQWRTVETTNFVFHFPEHYREWTLALASRMEGVREQVGRVVGFVPPQRVHVVVDDPLNDANGAAFTTLDAPTIVLYPTPPTPREEIGNFRVWGEMVATHEFAHVAHLNRPSRNRLQKLLQSLSPVPLGPIAPEAPRWVLEGYATYVEGRVTGSGRPNHAWRAAILRQFALEGRLPGYGQVSANGPFQTGNFAYLAGSAFLEWLSRREGDSSVTALWRRMTAKKVRSFDEAFSGVYGDAPSALYQKFVAAVTADALAFERTIHRDAFVPGTLVQRLIRETGDPAISPDGRFVALVVRHVTTPSELVIWSTADEPDTLAAARRAALVASDPDDVPDRTFYPPAKHTIIALVPTDGAPYESPRWMADNRHLLVTRRMPMSDGSLRPDLFMWSAEDGTLMRLTTGAAVRDPDPSSDGLWAAAVRCDRGWCDLVRIDMRSGQLRVLAPGSATHNYYRPRVSHTTGEIVVSEQAGDRWRLVRVSPDDGSSRYADPDDGVTRYDATFDTDGRTIVATSEAGGVANLERLDPTSRATRLTVVTGAAVAPDVAPDGTIWFLSLEAGGYDLRRIRPDSSSIIRARNASAPLYLSLVDSLSSILPPRVLPAPSDSSRRPPRSALSAEYAYGAGPSRYRYFPGATTGGGGSSLLLGIVRSDPAGRLGIQGLAAVGAGSMPAGVSLTSAWHGSRTEKLLSLWSSHEAPSARFGEAFADGLDLTRSGGAVRLQRRRAIDGGELAGQFGLLAERQHSLAFESRTRAAAVAAFTAVGRQRDEEVRYVEQFSGLGEFGSTGGAEYHRQRTAFFFGVGTGAASLTTVRIAYGTAGGGDGSDRERYVIGGFASPLIDPVLDARRVDAPAYPVGSAVSTSFSSFRVAIPISPVELFYAGASPDLFRTSLRSYGLELHERVAAVPALGTPDVEVLAGFARALDAPITKEWRYYVSLNVRP
ncbi:hypothetical protein BH11GEM1_BH11GEM1_17850 [soil metagenome]